MSETVVDTLAALHAVDIHATDIVNIGKPEGLVRRQVRVGPSVGSARRPGTLEEMETMIRWLEHDLPPESGRDTATIVHNDFKLDNLMLAKDDPARVIAVLDWEMTTVGDPLIDLGFVLTYWTMRGPQQGEQNRSLTGSHKQAGLVHTRGDY